ncbi:MAG: FadR/GntR family transcriptional regulator [bacterium]
MLTPLKRSRVSDDVLAQLVDRILAGDFASGQRLPPERELAQQLGVNRTSVREALRQLESMGLVRIRQGDGIYVKDRELDPTLAFLHFISSTGTGLDARFVMSLDEIRRIFALAMVELAAERVDDEGLARLEAVLERYPRDDTQQLLLGEWDFRFFREIARATGNPIFVYLMNTVREIFGQLRGIYLELDEREQQSVAELNGELLAALKDHDPRRAVAVLQARMDRDRAVFASRA